jgi:hypothetical protein
MVLPYAHTPHILPVGSGLELRSQRSRELQALQLHFDDGFREFEGSNIKEINPKFNLLFKKRLNPDGSTKMNEYKIVEFNHEELETHMEFDLLDDLVLFSENLNFTLGLQLNSANLTTDAINVYGLRSDRDTFLSAPVQVHKTNLKTNRLLADNPTLWRHLVSPSFKYAVSKMSIYVEGQVAIKDLLSAN